MSIGDRMLNYQHRWVSKLSETGSNTNPKRKRKGNFGNSNKGGKRSKYCFIASGKSAKGGGKARNKHRIDDRDL
eukprot:309097-Karenia_brevis.AAC.1